MKPETLIGTAMLALIGAALVVYLAGQIGPRPPRAPAVRAAPADAATQPAIVAAPTRAPLAVTPSADAPDDARVRDARRIADLQAIASILEAYRASRRTYPSTGGQVQTACVFLNLDKLCELRETVGLERLRDPRGNPNANGYWYASDGASFVLVASMEGAVTGGDPCPPSVAVLRAANLLCLAGGAR